MWELSLQSLLLIAFPETVALTLLAFAFARLEFKPAPVLLIGTIEAFLAFFVRKLPVFFGIHTLILMCALALMLHLYRRHNLAGAVTASFLAMSILTLLDLSVVYVLSWTWPAYFELAEKNTLVWAMSSYPYTAFMVLLAALINNRNKKRKQLSKTASR